MRHLGFSAPDQLQCRLKGLSVSALVDEGAKLRPSRSSDPVTAATKASIAPLAHRIQSLEREIAELDATLAPLLSATTPELLALYGVGPDSAAALLVAAGDNPERLRSEAAWAHLCGVAPIPASSGKSTGRYRLNTGGTARPIPLWHIVITRLAWDPHQGLLRAQDKEGRTKREVIRSLKRYIAREVYRNLPRA